jgi:hypothetical protein
MKTRSTKLLIVSASLALAAACCMEAAEKLVQAQQRGTIRLVPPTSNASKEDKPNDEGAGMPPAGMVAFTIAHEYGVYLFGSHVDIVATTGKGDNEVSKIILENVLVLDPKDANQMATTLAVTKETAQMLRNARKQGSLRPIYRAFEDGEKTQAVLKALEKWRKNTNRAMNRP